MIKFMKYFRETVVIVVVGLMLTAVGLQAEPNDDVLLKIRVGDVFAYPGEQNVLIPVYLTNYNDTVDYFDLLFRSNRSDIGFWRTDVDTVGTLTGGWNSIHAIYMGMGAELLRVVAFSRDVPHNGIDQPLYPQESQSPAFRLQMDAATLDDTTSIRDIQIGPLAQPADNFIVGDIHNAIIGLAFEHYLDSNYYFCDAWDEIISEDCLSWRRVSGPPYDSIAIFPDSMPYIDTNIVIIERGTLTIVRCGNFDGSSDNKVNLADITSMIAFVYLDGDEPSVARAANVNGSIDGKVNLADITRLIGHVYLGTGPLACE